MISGLQKRHHFKYGMGTGSGNLCFFSSHQWLLIQGARTVILQFEEDTRMVSRDYGIMDRVLKAE